MMRNIKIVLEYDGTNYYGFCRQPSLPTIQGKIEDAIERVFQERISIIPASRTDAHVHALGQVVNFKTKSKMTEGEIGNALNANLPEDIRVVSVEEVALNFHARYLAKSKEYVYYLINGENLPVFLRKYVYLIPEPLNIEAVVSASKAFIGEHNFKNFCAEDGQRNFVRNIYSIDVEGLDFLGLKITLLRFVANGFLYKMVRFLTSALIDVGRDKIKVDKLVQMLEGKVEQKVSSLVPPQGLYLAKVGY